MSDQDNEKQLGEIVIYQTESGQTGLNVVLQDETVWLTQKQLVDLFQSSKANISEHISHIFAEGELSEQAVVRKIRTTAADGKTYLVNHYNLDLIISLGYRIQSRVATHFRQWATGVIREYIVKGFALDDERLKQLGGGNYWRELLDRIRDIRSSEKMMYRQVLDLYATAIDYDPHSPISTRFFATVQNKLHYASHGHTAAEVIYQRADADKPFMGLTSFKGDHPVLADVSIAKNYLTDEELKALNTLVSGYFDLAELRASRKQVTTMEDYLKQLDQIIEVTGGEVLQGAGKISAKRAKMKAEHEYREYEVKELSPVEKQYLTSLKGLEQKIEHYKDQKND